MVASLLHPLNIFILGLGGGFLIPLLEPARQGWVVGRFLLALVGDDADLRRRAASILARRASRSKS